MARSPYRRNRTAQPRGGTGALQTALEGVRDVDFGALRGELSAMAQGLTNELFGAGGPVEQASSQALRGTVQSGFGPTSGGYTNARQNILRGARDQVANRISQGAIQLAPLALQQQESLFGGQATIEQLRLAREQMDQNQRLIDQRLQDSGCGIGDRLGNIATAAGTGALAGAGAGGFGAIPGIIGGGLVGLFQGC